MSNFNTAFTEKTEAELIEHLEWLSSGLGLLDNGLKANRERYIQDIIQDVRQLVSWYERELL